MKILDSGALQRTFNLLPGDTFNLLINNEVVHSYSIYGKCETVSHWAAVQVGNSGCGYFVGDYTLIIELTKLCG